MELMDKSLHDLYKLVYENIHLTIPEWVVGKMAEAVSHFTTHTHTHSLSLSLPPPPPPSLPLSRL